MENICRKAKKFADDNGIIRDKDNILAAVSGGPDSIFLLLFLLYLLRNTDITVKVAYIHHNLRKEADAELLFVKRFTRENSLPFFYRNVKIEGKSGIEEQARLKRYRALYSIAQRSDCNKIAVGHTLDDQAETIVMRLIKGAGLAGLCGMSPEKHLLKKSSISVIRPLLTLEKEEILNVLKEEKIPYKIDRSNFTGDFFRNHIRRDVLPVLLKLNPGFKKQITQMSFLVQDDFAFISNVAEETVEQIFDEKNKILDIRGYQKLDISIKRYVAAILIKKITGNPYRSFNKIRQLSEYLSKTPRKKIHMKELKKICGG